MASAPLRNGNTERKAAHSATHSTNTAKQAATARPHPDHVPGRPIGQKDPHRPTGPPADPVTLYDNFMPKSPYKNGDPWITYVGDAKGRGYGCYSPCAVDTGNAYLDLVGSSMRVTDVRGNSMSYYESLIDRGIPVILRCTVGMNRNPRICREATVNGKNVNRHSSSHCTVPIGYTDDNYIFCDPLNGIKEYSKSSTETSFAINYRQTCIVS